MRMVVSYALALVCTGCLTTRDLGVDDEGGGGSGTTTNTSAVVPVTSEPTTDGETSTPTASDGETSMGGTSGSSGGSTVTSASESASTTGSATGMAEAQTSCTRSGGTWELESCGHYTCGFPPRCDAIDPGCNCGVGFNFEQNVGCVEDAACGAFEFACGDDLSCIGQLEYCDVFLPGQPGPTDFSCLDLPEACVGDPTCECMDAAEGIAGECSLSAEGGIVITLAAP